MSPRAPRRCLDCDREIQHHARDSRCASCRSELDRERDAARGSRQERGYDAEHDAARAEWAPLVAAGRVRCRRAEHGLCLELNPVIQPDEPWQLGHPDRECPAPRAPEHQRCNASTALVSRRP